MKTFFVIFFYSLLSFSADLNYKAFEGTWQLSPENTDFNCVNNYSKVFNVEVSAETGTVIGKFQNNSYIGFKNINRGKSEFNSCFEDGIRGYTEVVGKDLKITETTVYLKPGLFCSSNREDYRRVTRWEIKNGILKISWGSRGLDEGPLLMSTQACTFQHP